MAPIMIATAWSAIMENSTVRACRRFISRGNGWPLCEGDRRGLPADAVGLRGREAALPVRYVA